MSQTLDTMVIGSSVPHLSVSSCVFEYNDPNDYFDVSNHEVDRQDDLEYEVRKRQLHFQQPNDTKWKCSKNSFGSFSHSLTQWLSTFFKHWAPSWEEPPHTQRQISDSMKNTCTKPHASHLSWWICLEYKAGLPAVVHHVSSEQRLNFHAFSITCLPCESKIEDTIHCFTACEGYPE